MSYFKFHWKGVQNALNIFYKSLKSLVQRFATFCIWKMNAFGFKFDLSLISKLNLKRKCLIDFKSVFLKQVFWKGFERFENYLIWSPKRLIPKRIWKYGVNLLFDFKKRMKIENLLFSFLKKLWNWFGLIWKVPKEFIQSDLKIKFKCFICFLKSWKSLV